MSIATVRTALQSIEAAYLAQELAAGRVRTSGRAYDQLPHQAINDADLPVCLNFVREATADYTNPGEDYYQTTRQYLVWLLVLPAAEGLSDGEAESMVEPLIPTFYAYINARPKLNAVTDVKRANIASDSGPRQLIWADTVYWGVEFRVNVTERLTRAYTGNE